MAFFGICKKLLFQYVEKIIVRSHTREILRFIKMLELESNRADFQRFLPLFGLSYEFFYSRVTFDSKSWKRNGKYKFLMPIFGCHASSIVGELFSKCPCQDHIFR